jgi:membrane protease YdiL (CAAX protease family)
MTLPGFMTESKTDGNPDSALCRIRSGWPGAQKTINSDIRRFEGLELLVVLAIFPLGATYAAVQDLTQRIQTHVPVVAHAIPPINGTWLPVLFGSVVEFIQLGAAFLVWYLLARSGEGLESINLGGRRLRMDLAYLLPVFVIVQWLPQLIGSHILNATGLQGYFLIPSPQFLSLSALTTEQIVASVVAGILEEIVILGYLVRRLEQRGFNGIAVVAIDVAVRVSYHLYYGWNVIPIACWALVSVLVYLRVRRLLPFILCHIAWDAVIPFRAFYHTTYQALQLSGLVVGIVFTLLWGRWRADAPRSGGRTSREWTLGTLRGQRQQSPDAGQ